MDERPRGARPADQSDLRRHNLRLVLRHIYDEGPRSRAMLSTETGLNRSTISSLTAELLDRGLIVERGQKARSIGRPSQSLEVSPKLVAFGVEFALDRIGICAVDLGGRVRHSTVARQDHHGIDPDMGVEEMAALVETTLAVVSRREFKVVGLAVGVPGLVDAGGKVVAAPKLGWEGVPLARLLREKIDLPALVDSSTNLAVHAELTNGVGYRHKDFVYVYGDDGISVAVVVGGQLIRGESGLAGAIGHCVTDVGGGPCVCGNDGCLDTLVSREAILAAGGISGDSRESLLQLAERARAGESRAVGALESASAVLAATIGPICSVLAPEAVVLGGDLAQIAEWLIGDLDDFLASRVLAARWSRCGVETSAVLDQPAARGGAQLALRHIYDDPTLAPRRSDELIASSVSESDRVDEKQAINREPQ
jgi:predicted NBD/HSP70 family sugar kinase